ncbi:unnamed protein product [Rotaria socialis]|uniref:HAT C-terminal dimerisation domain-containing protein n=1 Tax=Rotaria socialis TaxID=392032 RepID=A0A821A6S8_9BILA|nr:unnamed protein product [Rotaria socialis]CAF4420375.1 unnamed protein product [Rotaria socialis]CAF4569941.1 unnamed protein product [Rotaria socialis]
MSKFLSSLGKMNSPFSSSIRPTATKQLNEEIVTYRSLAQKEYNLIVDATSVASKSAFSTASYLLRKQQSRLTPNNLSYSMFLKDKFDDDNDELDI